MNKERKDIDDNIKNKLASTSKTDSTLKEKLQP